MTRPTGIKVIASILFLDALILLTSAVAAYFLPLQVVQQINQFFATIPYFKRLPLAIDPWLMVVAASLGAWSLTKGLAVWFMQSWVRILIMLDLAGRFGDFFLVATLQDRKWLDSLVSNPDFVIGFLINLCILIYLSDAGVKEAFEQRSTRQTSNVQGL